MGKQKAMDRTAFLTALYEKCPTDAVFELRPRKNPQVFLKTVVGKDKYTYPGWAQSMNIDKVVQYLPEAHHFFGVALRDGEEHDGKRGGKKNCKYFPAVWVDIDFKDINSNDFNDAQRQANERVQGCPIEPSIIVYTGGGYHLYWLLASAASKEEADIIRDANARLCYELGGDPSRVDTASVLRLPDTVNPKPDYDNPMVRVLKLNANMRYPLFAFKETLPEAPVKAKETADVRELEVKRCYMDPTEITEEMARNEIGASYIGLWVPRWIKAGASKEEAYQQLLHWYYRIPEEVREYPKADGLGYDLGQLYETFDHRWNSEFEEMTAVERVSEWMGTLPPDTIIRTREINAEFNLEKAEKDQVRAFLNRKVSTGDLERVKRQAGAFRMVDKSSDTRIVYNPNYVFEESAVRLPLDLNDLVIVPPGSIVNIVGSKSAGKSAFMLNVALLNHQEYKVKYLYYEPPAQLFRRFDRFKNVNPRVWQEKIYFDDRRDGNFQDHVWATDDAMNICDWLNAGGEKAYNIGDKIEAIRSKAGNSVLVIGQQLNNRTGDARGGETASHLTELEIQLRMIDLEVGGMATIRYCKIPTEENLDTGVDGMVCLFKCVHGGRWFYNYSGWHPPQAAKGLAEKSKYHHKEWVCNHPEYFSGACTALKD